MLMMIESEHALVEVASVRELSDPFAEVVMASRLKGEEQQEPEPMYKSSLCFASGEALPSCWKNAHYRDDELKRFSRGYDRVWQQADVLAQNQALAARDSLTSKGAFPFYGS